MLYDPINGMLYDFCGGAEDIEHRRIRTIIDAEESFLEDPGKSTSWLDRIPYSKVSAAQVSIPVCGSLCK
jgi:hypothetical protein